MKKKVKKKQKVEYTLPTEKSIPIDDIGGYTILIFGKKKIGKTTICQHFKNTLFFMLERGAKKLSIYKREPKTWFEFKKYVALLQKDKTFDTVVIDPPDIAYDLCLRYVCDTKLGIDHPGGVNDYGKSWNAVKSEFISEIRKIENSGKGVIFISHQKETEIEKRDGKKYSMLTNTMPGQAKEVIEGMVDLWANYDYDGEKRTLIIQGDDFIDAGHRLNEPPNPKFLYTNGEPIREIPMGKTSKEAYDNLTKAFNNKLEKPRKEEKVKVGKKAVKKKTGLKLRLKK